MTDRKTLLDSLLAAHPSVTVTLSGLRDPDTRSKLSKLFGVVRTTPEEPPKEEGSQAPAPELGPDHAEGSE